MTQSFEDGGRIDSHRATNAVIELIIPRQRLQIAVEDDADELAGAVDHRTSGIAADDVGGADEVEGRAALDGCFFCSPRLRQLERRLVVVLRSSLKRPIHRRGPRNLFSVLDIALHSSE